MRIDMHNTLVLVIDYQEKLVPAMYDSQNFVNNSKKLIQGLKKLQIPFIVSQQYTKGLGDTISPIAEVLSTNLSEDKYEVNDKITFSCVKDINIYAKVVQAQCKNVIICGCEAHICVLQTVIDLIKEGYNVYLVQDCIASRKANDKDIAIVRAISEGAFITTYEAILFELCQKAGNDTFKYISKLIK